MTRFYEPKNGHGLPHDPFNAIVGPRPIGWVSTRSNDGVLNLAPYSFFTAFNYIPPIVGFSSTGPLVCLKFTPNSFAMMCDNVVLPSPGGPNNST